MFARSRTEGQAAQDAIHRAHVLASRLDHVLSQFLRGQLKGGHGGVFDELLGVGEVLRNPRFAAAREQGALKRPSRPPAARESEFAEEWRVPAARRSN